MSRTLCRRLLLAATTTLTGGVVAATLLPLTGTATATAQPAGSNAAVLSAQAVSAALPVPAPTSAPATTPTTIDEVIAQQTASGLDCAATAGGLPLCVHGADAAPADDEAHDHSTHDHGLGAMEAAGSGSSGSSTGGQVGCHGDGTSGPRVRAIYARPETATDRYTSLLPSIRNWAASVSGQFDASAAVTKGRRHVRFATTPGPSCMLTVLNVPLPASAFTTFKATVEALEARGFNAAFSKYLIWADASGYCGIASTYADDRPDLGNLNNSELPSYARVDSRCWGKVEAHEVVHMMGGVQRSAKNSTGGFHCNDGVDVMCYNDGTANATQRAVCPKERARLLDCRNDDYFSTAAPRGSYLQTHWNVARSSFLAATLSESTTAGQANSPSTGPSASPSSSPSPAAPRPSSSPSTSPKLIPTVSIPALPAAPVLTAPAAPAAPPAPVTAPVAVAVTSLAG